MEISKIELTFEELLHTNELSKEIIDRINMELIDVLIKKMKKYSGGDSSLSKERTQSLMDSIVYTLTFYFKSMDNQDMIYALYYQDISDIYEKSHNYLLRQVHLLYLRVMKLQKEILDFPLLVYHETLAKGLPAFFEVYNFDYCAHDSILTLDYPTCRPLQKCGLERIIEYVSYIEIEHYFLHCFSLKDIKEVVMGYCYYQKDMIDNISLLFLNQILVKSLLGKNDELLFKHRSKIDKVYRLLENKSKEEIYQLLYNQLTVLVTILQSPYRQEIFNYFSYILEDVSSSLFHHCKFHTLDKALACTFT